MRESYQFIKKKEKILFKNLEERSFFFSGGVLYKKILQQDLLAFGINNVNAVSILNGGLTKFDADEKVYGTEVERVFSRN